MSNTRRCRDALIAAGIILALPADSSAGRRSVPVSEPGLQERHDILYVLDFDEQGATEAWYGDKDGYGWTDDPEHVFYGGGALEIQQIEGSHQPSEIHPEIEETDVAYVRWYRKWEEGYDWTQHKMPGVYARAPGVGGGGAGIPPNGMDKFSSKLFVTWDAEPRFYSYHPDQAGDYGDALPPNLGIDVELEADRWYCFEMMIKANDAPNHDGELKMWIDGELVGHYENMRFRDTNDLKINEFTYSAYVGGTWTSERDQKLWDDQIVVATNYIGPIDEGGGDTDTSGGDSGGTGGSGSGPGPDTGSGSSSADGPLGTGDGSSIDSGGSNGGDAAPTGSEGSGCACRATSHPAPGGFAVVVGFVIAARRRTRTRQVRCS